MEEGRWKRVRDIRDTVVGVVGWGVIILVVVVLKPLYPFHSHDTWLGHVYPDSDNLTEFVTIGEFNSLETCTTVSLQSIEGAGLLNADFECTRNCKPMVSGTPNTIFICDDPE